MVSRNINKLDQALPSGQFDIWYPWSETWASSYIRQMVEGENEGFGTRPYLGSERQIMDERETLRRKLDALDTADDNMEGLDLF